jgi:hypothetical protein
MRLAGLHALAGNRPFSGIQISATPQKKTPAAFGCGRVNHRADAMEEDPTPPH